MEEGKSCTIFLCMCVCTVTIEARNSGQSSLLIEYRKHRLWQSSPTGTYHTALPVVPITISCHVRVQYSPSGVHRGRGERREERIETWPSSLFAINYGKNTHRNNDWILESLCFVCFQIIMSAPNVSHWQYLSSSCGRWVFFFELN